MASIELVARTVLLRDWGEEHIIAHTAHYLGKLLFMRAGTKGGLQFHRQKDETECLWSGLARLRTDRGDGVLEVRDFAPGQSVHIPPGVVHQVEAVTDCVIFETSTPHLEDRVRVEAQYGLPDGGGLPTTR